MEDRKISSEFIADMSSKMGTEKQLLGSSGVIGGLDE